jgi:phosphatidyl-myo-inositol alpha-mannosyltransferase
VRVALACPYAWDAPGGVQVHVRQLSEHLRARGHQVLVVAPGATDPADPGVRIVGRPVRIPFNGSVVPICPDPRSRSVIRRRLGEFGPDVVHVHEPFSPSTGMFAALTAPVPVVATFHAYAERSVALAAFAPLLTKVWNRLAVRLAVSNAAAEFAGRHFRGEVRVVPNGLDVEPFQQASPAELPGQRRLLFVGRLEPRKGLRFAIRAFRLLADEFADAVLVVAGDGPERKAAQELPPSTRDRVIMLGAVSRTDLPHYHAAADAFLAPNTGGESFGIVLVEAMAAGLPVVASDIPGYREVVRHEVEGLLVPPRDPAALADAVRRLFTDDDLAGRLGANGRQRAERFAWPVVAEEIEGAYRQALAFDRR